MKWYAGSELAGLPEMPTTVDGVRYKANKEQWKTRKRKGRGGGKEYHITSLPIETQSALLNSPKGPHPAANLSGSDESSVSVSVSSEPDVFFEYDREALWQNFDKKSDKQKDKARKKYEAIVNALTLIELGIARTKAWQAAAKTHEVHLFTLRDQWYASVKNYHRSDWLAALVPGHVGRTSTAECDPLAWDFFKADYLRLERPTAAACYRRLQRAAEAHDWKIPSIDSIERKIKRDIPTTVLVLMREGEQALYRLYPAQKRTVRELHALEAINGDGYMHNVFVKFPCGKVARPKTWFWQDIHSRKLLTYRVDYTENTDSIRLSFGDLVEKFGIPKHVTIDNTRAAANKWMSGGIATRFRFKVKEDDPLGLFPTLGIKVHWTSVFNGQGSGQSKPIERAFGVGGLGEVVDKHPALAGCYTGANPMAKPENYGDKAIPLDDFLYILEQEVIAFNDQAKRRTEMCGGVHSFDHVFNESYKRAAITKPTEAQRRLWLLSAEAVKVQRGGVVSLDAGSAVGVGRNRYRSDYLFDMVGKKVVVRFDPQSLHEEVFIYDLKGSYIDKAVCIEDAGFYDTKVAREHSRARKQFIKANKDAAAAETRMDAIEASGFLPNEDGPSVPDVKIIRPFKPEVNNTTTVVSEEERQQLAEEIQTLNNVARLETPRQKYFRWVEISKSVDRSDEEQHFYESYPKTAEFRAERDICEEFGLMPESAEAQ